MRRLREMGKNIMKDPKEKKKQLEYKKINYR